MRKVDIGKINHLDDHIFTICSKVSEEKEKKNMSTSHITKGRRLVGPQYVPVEVVLGGEMESGV